MFEWEPINHNATIYVKCPFNYDGKSYAKRSCLLLTNGSVVWGSIDDNMCLKQSIQVNDK